MSTKLYRSTSLYTTSNSFFHISPYPQQQHQQQVDYGSLISSHNSNTNSNKADQNKLTEECKSIKIQKNNREIHEKILSIKIPSFYPINFYSSNNNNHQDNNKAHLFLREDINNIKCDNNCENMPKQYDSLGHRTKGNSSQKSTNPINDFQDMLNDNHIDIDKIIMPNTTRESIKTSRSSNVTPLKSNLPKYKFQKESALNHQKYQCKSPIDSMDNHAQDALELKIKAKFKLDIDRRKNKSSRSLSGHDISHKFNSNQKRDKMVPCGPSITNDGAFNITHHLQNSTSDLTTTLFPNNMNYERLPYEASIAHSNDLKSSINERFLAKASPMATTITDHINRTRFDNSHTILNNNIDQSIPQFFKEVTDLKITNPISPSQYLQELTSLNHKISSQGNSGYNSPNIAQQQQHLHELPKIYDDMTYSTKKSQDNKNLYCQGKRSIELDFSNIKKEAPTIMSTAQSSRIEIRKVSQWIEENLKGIILDKTISENAKCIKCDDILNFALNEIIRQVSIECSERGNLLARIWLVYIRLFGRIKEALALENEKKIQEFDIQYLKTSAMYKEIIEKKQIEITKLNQIIKDIQNTLQKIQIDYDDLLNKDNLNLKKLENMKKVLKNMKIRNNELQIENEYLQMKCNNFTQDANSSASQGKITHGVEHNEILPKSGKNDFGGVKKHLTIAKKHIKAKVANPNNKSKSSEDQDNSNEVIHIDNNQQPIKVESLNYYGHNQHFTPFTPKHIEYEHKETQIDQQLYETFLCDAIIQTDLQLIDIKYDKIIGTMKNMNMILEDHNTKESLNIIDAVRILIEKNEGKELNIDLTNATEEDISNFVWKRLDKSEIDLKESPNGQLGSMRNIQNPVMNSLQDSLKNGLNDSTKIHGQGEIKDLKIKIMKKSEYENNNNNDNIESPLKYKSGFFKINEENQDNHLKTLKTSLTDVKIIPQLKSIMNIIASANIDISNDTNNMNNILIDQDITRYEVIKETDEERLGDNESNELIRTQSRICSDGDFFQSTSNIDKELGSNNNMIDEEITRALFKSVLVFENKNTIGDNKKKLMKLITMYSTEVEKNKALMKNLDLLQENMLEEQSKNIKASEEITELNDRINMIIKENESRKIYCPHGKCPICLEEQIKKDMEDKQKEESLPTLVDEEEELEEEKALETEKNFDINNKDNQVKGKNKKRSRHFSLSKSPIIKKHNLLEKRINNGAIIVDKLRNKQLSKFKNFMPMKLVLKQITNIYEERIMQTKENPAISEIDLSIFTLHSFMNNFGFKKIAEQKYIIFILSLKRYLHIVRINLFARFIGLLDPKSNYSNDEFNKYIEAADYINNSKMAVNIIINESDTKHYIAYLRFLDYLKTFCDGKMPFEEYMEFKREFEPLKEKDPKNINRFGIIAFDVSMAKVLYKYKLICNRTKQYVISAFKAADLDMNNLCNLKEFLLLYKYIESEKYDHNFAENLFNIYAEKGDNIEKSLSLDKFTILSVEYGLFTDQQQDQFLNVANKSDIDIKYHQFKTEFYVKSTDIKIRITALKKCDTNEKEYWLNIINCIENRINKEGADINNAKPILIAFTILENELNALEDDEMEGLLEQQGDFKDKQRKFYELIGNFNQG